MAGVQFLRDLMISALYFVCGLAGVFAVRQYAGGFRRNISNPFVLAMTMFCVAYFFIPLLGIWTDAFRYQEAYAMEVHAMYLLCTALFFLTSFSVVVLLRGRARYAQARARFLDLYRWTTLRRSDTVVVFALLAVPGGASLLWMLNRVASIGFNTFVNNRIVFNSGLGYQIMPLAWFTVALVVLYGNELVRKARTGLRVRPLGLAVLFVLCIASALLLGSRSRALWPILYLSLVYLFLQSGTSVSSRRVLRMALLGVFLLGLASVLGDVRHQISGGRALSRVEVELPGSAVARGLLGAFGEYENVLWLLDNQGSYELLWGQTFGAAMVGMVPRRIWPEKPLGGGPHLRNMIHPGSYDLQRGSGLTSYTTGLPAEAIMNFGPAGVVLVGGFYGIAVLLMTQLLGSVRGPIAFACWFFALHRLTGVLSAEFFGTLAHLFGALVPLGSITVVTWLLKRSSGTGPHSQEIVPLRP